MSIFCFLIDIHMTSMHSTETVFVGIIREGVASFMWAAFVRITGYFLSAVF